VCPAFAQSENLLDKREEMAKQIRKMMIMDKYAAANELEAMRDTAVIAKAAEILKEKNIPVEEQKMNEHAAVYASRVWKLFMAIRADP
jgi:hypothetical protein